MVSQNGRCSGYNLPKIQTDKKKDGRTSPKTLFDVDDWQSWGKRILMDTALSEKGLPSLSGWWYTYPSEKWWSSSVGDDDIPNIWKVINFQILTIYVHMLTIYLWLTVRKFHGSKPPTSCCLTDLSYLLKKPFHWIKLVVDPTAAIGENNYLLYESCFLLSKTSHYTIIRKRSLTHISSLKSQSFAC